MEPEFPSEDVFCLALWVVVVDIFQFHALNNEALGLQTNVWS